VLSFSAINAWSRCRVWTIGQIQGADKQKKRASRSRSEHMQMKRGSIVCGGVAFGEEGDGVLDVAEHLASGLCNEH